MTKYNFNVFNDFAFAVVSLGKLKSHEKTHSKSRPFKCIDCNKTFTVRYSLICHTRTHTRERPYQCSV